MFVRMLAPRRGLEPRTHWLTASRSTIELSGSAYAKEAEATRPSASFECRPGDDLLSHSVARAVPSALEGLTAVFGMGTGVAPPLESPGKMGCHGSDRCRKHRPGARRALKTA